MATSPVGASFEVPGPYTPSLSVEQLTAELMEVRASQARIEAMLVTMMEATVKATTTIDKVAKDMMPTVESLLDNPVIQMALGTRKTRKERKALGQ